MAVLTASAIRHAGGSLWGTDRTTLALRGTVGAVALSLFYFGIGRLPLGDAVTIQYTAPVWTALTAALLLGERIRPVAKAVTDPDALIKVSAAAAQREPLSGAQLNTQLCAGCHSAGVLGAPKTGDGAAWAQRRDAAGGIDGDFDDPAPWYFRTIEGWQRLLADCGFERVVLHEPRHADDGPPASAIFVAAAAAVD
jgi:cytochrome c5